MKPWAACLPMQDARAAGSLRLVSGIDACEHQRRLWLRGTSLDERLELQLRALPGAERFLLLADGQLVPPEARVPRGRLPPGPWARLDDWLSVELPGTVWPGLAASREPFKLVRSDQEEEASVLLLHFDDWHDYCVSAPQARLDCWHFAVCADGRVVVCGQPLPPLSGLRGTARDGVAVPAGWSFEPPIDRAVLQLRLGLAAGDVALFSPDGTWEWLRRDDFVRATRSAVRASAEALHHD
jgi:hypothetical protein